jgi:hypothetical protein
MTTCAHCKYFTLKNLPAGAADGEGQCIGYLEALQELVTWDRATCGIFRPAKEMAKREEWIAERAADAQKTGLNEAPRRANGVPGSPGHPWRK